MTRSIYLLATSCLILLEATSAFTSFLGRTCTLSSTRLEAKTNEEQENLISSRNPHELANGRGTFLGFRNVHDFKTKARSSSALNSEMSALIPDGGLSPCVIRVLGVGGGGCNAVSFTSGDGLLLSPELSTSR